ncbi:MAG: hypothetical protein U0103_02055 [Candidatus Obscuribacterales bacterium]
MELLVSVVVIGVAMAGITELMWVNATWSTRMLNKTDNLNAAKFFLTRIGKDIRASKSIGDSTNASPKFPPHSNIFTVGGDTLIIQIPLFDLNGFPIAATVGNGVISDVDTVVYYAKSDPRDSTGQTYQVMKSIYRGAGDAVLGNSLDQVVQNDVIGPIDKNTNKLAIFQYFDSSGGEIPLQRISGDFAACSTVTGVAVNLELNKTGESSTQINSVTTNRSNFVVKGEYFLRNKLLPG